MTQRLNYIWHCFLSSASTWGVWGIVFCKAFVIQYYFNACVSRLVFSCQPIAVSLLLSRDDCLTHALPFYRCSMSPFFGSTVSSHVNPRIYLQLDHPTCQVAASTLQNPSLNFITQHQSGLERSRNNPTEEGPPAPHLSSSSHDVDRRFSGNLNGRSRASPQNESLPSSIPMIS